MSTAAQIHQQDLERLKSLRYMEDDFMTVCLADNFEGVELILRIVLGRADITVKSVRTQELMKNLQGRSAVLDVHAVDSANQEFDIEIQRSDAGAGAKRARHNSSLLDTHILKPGDDTEDIPDSYVIFITENDVMKGNQPLYPVERYVRCTNPENMNYEALAKRARYFKQDEKGVAVMCKILEDMRNEAAKEAAQKAELKSARETAERLIIKGKMTLEEIAECIPVLSLD